MARPLKTNADYFPHMGDMRNDPKIKALRKKYSHLGYAIWCFLIETLTESDDFRVEWDELMIELLAADFDCSVDELTSVASYLEKLKLIKISDDFLSCPKLLKFLDPLLSKRERQRKQVIDDDNSNEKELSTSITQNKEVIDVESTQSKVKKSKVKKSSSSPPLPPHGGASAAFFENRILGNLDRLDCDIGPISTTPQKIPEITEPVLVPDSQCTSEKTGSEPTKMSTEKPDFVSWMADQITLFRSIDYRSKTGAQIPNRIGLNRHLISEANRNPDELNNWLIEFADNVEELESFELKNSRKTSEKEQRELEKIEFKKQQEEERKIIELFEKLSTNEKLVFTKKASQELGQSPHPAGWPPSFIKRIAARIYCESNKVFS